MQVTSKRTYGSRAGKAVKQMFKLCVEGEMLNLSDIAARLEVSEGYARKLLRREQGKPGPVTWNGLRQR